MFLSAAPDVLCGELEKSSAKLVEAIDKLTYWRADRELTPEEWIVYLRAAKLFQSAAPAERVHALEAFQETMLTGLM